MATWVAVITGFCIGALWAHILWLIVLRQREARR